MNIKKVDDRPMVIHTKEKPKLHVKGAPETKRKGRGVLAVRHGPEIAGAVAETCAAGKGKIRFKRSPVHAADQRKAGQAKEAAGGRELRGRDGFVCEGSAPGRNGRRAEQGRTASGSITVQAGNISGNGSAQAGNISGNRSAQVGNGRHAE